ncbi:hypothetical protein FJZ48_02425 [Candidatus Uhrbacteria bacterium]|nr:hypothetical protein [Candidatus Uhrbacteria bacterium]
MEQDLGKVLKEIGQAVIQFFQEQNPEKLDAMLSFEDYHGFLWSSLPTDVLEKILQPFGYTPEQIEVEVIKTLKDQRDEVHYHQESYAYVFILGHSTHFADPEKALTYKDGSWVPVHENESWLISPKTFHGFTVEDGGMLTFLSIQYPPIVQGDKDDYHLVR